MAKETMLAIDIGGTKIAVALVDGAVVLERDIVATPATAGPEAVMSAATEVARRLLATCEARPIAVGVACAGLVRNGHVRALSHDLLPGWRHVPLAERLQWGLGSPVFVLNDAQAAAFGESVYGAGRRHESLLFVTVSTGVGGGVVLDRRLWSGATGLAGHIGHLHGGRLERVTSGTALAQRAAERGHPISAREVLAAAEEGQQWAEELLDDGVRALSDVLTDVKLLLDLELVVLGGGVGLNPVFQLALRDALPAAGSPLQLHVASAHLGADAGLVGVAAWARKLESR